MKLTVLLVLLVSFNQSCLGYQMFQDKIPNGRLVPHPCKTNNTWQGVGHANPGGGGKRNPFGLDFYRNGKIWDECLCKSDSDGDGKTNGEELGDPDCEWSMFMTPKMTSGLSHPGVCEPIDSPKCQILNKDLGDFCDKGDEASPCIKDVKAQDGVMSLRISFPESPVPAKETSYVCQVFALPEDKDYHIIAAEPHIVNTQVMHHILVYGCKDSANVTDGPAECGMAEKDCNDLILTWGVGYGGYCLDEAFGFRIGQTGYKRVLMQTHWNNPELRSDYTDSSGMVIYYTPNMRPNDGGMMMTGQIFLHIPPGEEDYRTWGTCASGCTRLMPHPIYIVESMIHMHYLGSKGYIEHYRNGTKVTDLVTQDVFSFDVPVPFSYKEPVEFLPGDTIKTICHFKSIGQTEVTNYGEATSDEMCLGFLTYYPKIPGVSDCLSWINTPACEGALPSDSLVGGCNYTDFAVTGAPFYPKLYESCDVTGSTCKPDCRAWLSEWSAREPCLRGEALEVLKTLIRVYAPDDAKDILNYMASCDAKDNRTPKEDEKSREESHRKTGPLCPKEENDIYDKVGSASTTAPALLGIGMALIGSITWGH